MARPLDEAELLKLVDVLAAGELRSGEDLAAQAGVTRAALAKRVDHLRAWGLDLIAEPGRGYRLAAPLERLEAARIRAALPAAARKLLHGLQVLARTDSTNQRVLEADAAADPQALFAEAQTAGRGRRGRAWRSPFGANLYFSLAWSFPAWPPQLTALPLVVGLACAGALRTLGAREIRLKWPNDLRIGAAKLGGILVEQRGEAGGPCRCVIGVGLNLAMTPAQAGALDQPWTSLREVLGAMPSRNAVAGALLGEIMTALPRFQAEGFAPFAAGWAALDATANQPVRIEGAGPPLEGIGRGVDANGALIVESHGKRHLVHAGEVSLRLGTKP